MPPEKKLTPTFGSRAKKLIEEAGIDPDLINDDKLSTARPPWKLNNPTINLTLLKRHDPKCLQNTSQ